MAKWVGLWLCLTFLVCAGSFFSSHVHLSERGHYSHLEQRFHILGKDSFERTARQYSESQSIPSFLAHFFDDDIGEEREQDAAAVKAELAYEDEIEELLAELEDYEDSEAIEEDAEEEVVGGDGDDNGEDEGDEGADEAVGDENEGDGGAGETGGEPKPPGSRRRVRRRRRPGRLHRKANLAGSRVGNRAGAASRLRRGNVGSRARARLRPRPSVTHIHTNTTFEDDALDHPKLKRYVENCRGSCVLTKLRRQSTDLNKRQFDRNHFDGVVSGDDESVCKGKCGRHGFCRSGKCVCVALYEGDWCERPVVLPRGLQVRFDEDFLLNAATLRPKIGEVITYKTNPKAGDGMTHTLKMAVSEDMVNLLPDEDILGAKYFDTCAIVGSSGVLLSTMKGQEIDSHDAVIRFNKAPTKGFETYVGSRTSLRLVNTNHALFRSANETVIQQMQSRTGWMIYRKIMKVGRGNGIPHFVFHPKFSSFVSSNTRALPTNGYFALWLSLHKCARVTMYGFFHSATFKFPYHYFNREVPRKGGTAIHDYLAELEDILRLAKHGTIQMSELCMSECHEWRGPDHHACETCPTGSTCMCETDMPIPVAKPGFCHVSKHRRSCFVKCPGGANQCPGVRAQDRMDKTSGVCPREVQEKIEQKAITLPDHC